MKGDFQNQEYQNHQNTITTSKSIHHEQVKQQVFFYVCLQHGLRKGKITSDMHKPIGI